MKKIYLGYLLTILSAAAFASMSLFIKWAYGVGMSAWSFSVIQSSLALAIMAVMLVREPGSALPRPRVPRVRLLFFVTFGAGAAIMFNLALVYLSISLATILLFTFPAFVALGAWVLLGQRPTPYHVAAILLTLAGAVLTTNISDVAMGAVTAFGIGLAFAAAVSHGLYMVLGEQVSGTLSAIRATAYTRIGILVGSVVLSPGVFQEIPEVPPLGWLICIGAAATSGVAPFLFLNRGIALIGANRAAIASVAELPFALALGMAFQGDVIRPLQWAGAALIVAAMVFSQRETPEHKSVSVTGGCLATSKRGKPERLGDCCNGPN